MDDTLRLFVTYVIVPIIFAIIGFITRNFHMRLDALEKEMPLKLSQGEVRQLVADKIDPIREDIHEIKEDLTKLIDLMIKKG